MQITVFGASGKVGRLVTAELLGRGHDVRAFVHSQTNLPDDQKLTVLQGDIRDQAAVTSAVSGSQAVLCALGSWGTKSKDIVSSGMRTIIPGMSQAGIERIVSLTGADARDVADRPSAMQSLTHSAIGLFAPSILHDGEEHIRLLRGSDLDWTVLRSPVMTNGGNLYKLSLGQPKPWQTIPRRAVAKAMADQLDGPSYSQAAPYIHKA